MKEIPPCTKTPVSFTKNIVPIALKASEVSTRLKTRLAGLFVVTRQLLRLSSPGQPHQEQPINSRRVLGVARVAILIRAPQNNTPRLDSVQEQSVFCVLHHPCQSSLEMFPRNCTASEDGPLVRLDCIELQSLEVSVVLFTVRVQYQSLTFEISSSVMQPPTSVLLAKTSRLAPMSRYSLISILQSVE